MNRQNDNKENRFRVLIGSILFVWLCLFFIVAFPEDCSAGKFIQTFLIRYGGSKLHAGDELLMAKFDLVAVQRFHYDDINGDSWAAVKAINPSTQIYLYQTSLPRNNCDNSNILYLDNLGRWNVSRGHSMGNLNSDNADLFLLDSNSNRIYNPAYASAWWADPGDSKYQHYFIEGTIHDLVDQKWTADGIFVDMCTIRRVNMSAMPVKYPTDEAWSAARRNFVNVITSGLNTANQKVWCNRTGVESEFGYGDYIALDNSPNPPDVVLEEGVFAVRWGPGDVQFFSEVEWKREIDIMSQIRNSKLTYFSHAQLAEGGSGTDNHGAPVTYWDVLWYAMGSYHIGKNTVDNNSYFGFTNSYNAIRWYDEYDYIDLGQAMSKYKVTNYDGTKIYWREFEKGYVFVNPTNHDVSSVSLPQACKQLTHDNLKKDPGALAKISAISLKANRAAILLKDTYDDVPLLSSPADLRIGDVQY
jgi:hypothetical protein